MGRKIVVGDGVIVYPLGLEHVKKALRGMDDTLTACKKLETFFGDRFPKRWADTPYCSSLAPKWQKDCVTRLRKPLPQGLVPYQ